MDYPAFGDLADKVKGCELVVVRFEREPDNKIYHRDEGVFPAQVNGTEYIGNGMPAAELLKHCIAAGLGAEMEFCIGAVSRDESERLVADELRADLARERTKKDLVPASREQVFNFIPAGVAPVRSIGKRIG
jgi:hypothetical protein